MRRGLPLLAAAALAAGCGSTSSSSPDGRTLFVQQCGACHSLADAGTHGSFGADLEKNRPAKQVVFDAITKGYGKNMAAQPMNRQDAEKVAAYVARVVRR